MAKGCCWGTSVGRSTFGLIGQENGLTVDYDDTKKWGKSARTLILSSKSFPILNSLSKRFHLYNFFLLSLNIK